MKHYYFVFQNLNFEHESTRGYLWCPYIDRRGVKHFYWDNIEKLKIGDILLHGANQKIVGISIVVDECFNAIRSEERIRKGINASDIENRKTEIGRQVNTKYIKFLNPIKTKDISDEIIKYCINDKYAPFDKNGKGKNGYIFNLNSSLFNIFLDKIIEQNMVQKEIILLMVN